VVGHLCEECVPGYWNIHSAAGCDPCNCDPIGSLSNECDLRTGACRCRPGVAGQRCDACAPHHWGFGLEGCKQCNCDMTGSLNGQCDELTGQCPCRDQVEGRRCQRCEENSETKKGRGGERLCKPCDSCYSLVKVEVDTHREQLHQLGELLQTIAENPEPVQEDFEAELDRVEVKVSALLEQVETSIGGGKAMKEQLEDLVTSLEEARRLSQEAEAILDEAVVGGEDARRRQRTALAGIRRAQVTLGRAQQQLEVDAKEALRLAQERARRFGEGSERMTGIAGRARELADQQARDAEDMKKRAEAALEMASNANQLARDALDEQVKKAERISMLRTHLEQLEGKLSTVQSLSLATLSDATDAYNRALNIYQEAFNLDPSSRDMTQMQEDATGMRVKAGTVRSTADKLLAENAELLGQVVVDREELEELLERAVSQQQQVNARLDDLTGHQGRAADAVERGNAVLEQARATLETLKNFEGRVNDNKRAANKALTLASQIEATISEAVEKTMEASELLQNTDKDSQMGLSLAKEAEDVAGKTSNIAREISASSITTREGTGRLLVESRGCQSEVMSTLGLIKGREEVAKRDKSLADQALREASKGQSIAEEAVIQVERAREELDEILRIIATVEEPEPGLLDDLERRLEVAEKKYEAAGLEARIQQLQEAKMRQTRMIFEYRASIEEFTIEYNSIEEIRNSLPDQCWNKIRLEP